jgi:hypothetical protein
MFSCSLRPCPGIVQAKGKANQIVSTVRLIVPLTDSEASHLLEVTIDGNIILAGRQFRTHAIVLFGSSLTGHANLVASLYNRSATSDVLA